MYGVNNSMCASIGNANVGGLAVWLLHIREMKEQNKKPQSPPKILKTKISKPAKAPRKTWLLLLNRLKLSMFCAWIPFRNQEKAAVPSDGGYRRNI